MDERKKRILEAIIDDYIQTATPVGSRTISRKYLQNLSSATIRNEMSDLEELGYLAQPHVSAGRVPNAKAYRLYVDMLLAEGKLPDVEDERFREQLFSRVSHLDDLVGNLAQALSDFTHYASLVMLPMQEELRISTLQLVPVGRASALLVIVTDAGIIRDTMVRVAERLDADALYAISRMLTERFAGRTLREVQGLLNEYAVHSPASPEVLESILDLSGQMERQSRADSLTVAGTHNILGYPEYQEADKARMLLSALEDKERLMKLVRDSGGLDLAVHIGPETGIPEMGECSVALAEYRVGRGRRGAIGLIGPTRMPYARVLETLRQVSRALTDALGE
ncbi:MAG TPA: heat-inducible transcriptional repressor HrcA [Candidatus Limnocylindria bacterium]|nr:heat-inducible transcriptional repressor HrcA [Candidatus Limnocylindria bacterium]